MHSEAGTTATLSVSFLTFPAIFVRSFQGSAIAGEAC
jgi:hypothetical protein